MLTVRGQGPLLGQLVLRLCPGQGYMNSHTYLLSHVLESICFTVLSSVSIKMNKNKKEIYCHIRLFFAPPGC